MLPRRLRLPRAAFTHTGKEMRITSPHFSVSVQKSTIGCGVVISKKTEKTSVGRHKLKRRIIAAIFPICSKEGLSVIVYARAGSPALPYTLLAQELTELLSRLLGPQKVR